MLTVIGCECTARAFALSVDRWRLLALNKNGYQKAVLLSSLSISEVNILWPGTRSGSTSKS
uniref:Uncharacterized protein n=1 Tax=Pristionchus pacificus TaxID=54126 RepID=A0A2A6B2J9_PRIPA|eukprot:PDM60092.1 hypothetical protein PRIPAC_49378 [Pristionchus pacificus]